MSETVVQSAAEGVPGLSQWQRVVNTFTAPSKTFEDITRGNRSWWLPFLITILASYILVGAITLKIGWAQVAENAIHLDPSAAEKLEQAPPAQREMTMKFTQYGIEGSFFASPVFVLIFVSFGSLVLWGTINFVFGGKATFGSIFVVWMYGSLPGIIKALLGAVAIFAGTAPESFNLNNFAPTSVGAFLNQPETNAALYKLASALDVTTIWSMVLLAIGIAAVAKVKRGAGYIAVFGWWTLYLLISVGKAAIFG
ncbi:MAG: YIP1 family protein [Terracidiphilus sp.]